jgi:signal transduction histidine kinase
MAEKEMQNAIRLRDEFIAIASHELRTPITPLKVQNQFLRKHLESGLFSSVPKAKDIIKMLDISDQQLNHLSALIEEMLEASRTASGKLTLARSQEDISALVGRVVTLAQNEIRRAGCDLRLDIQAGVQGRVDRIKIEQLTMNLLTNAIKYGQGKPIAISLWSENGQVKLRVQDHGIGIAKEDHARIYEQFERAAPVDTYGGLGLGLYLSRKIVDAHSGQIELDSELGKGATFTVTLPLA